MQTVVVEGAERVTRRDVWEECKRRAPVSLFLFRNGSVYESYGADAERVRAVLGCEQFAARHLDKYVMRLLAAGHPVGVVEQVEGEACHD